MPIENKRQILLIGFAIIAGIAATFLTSNYVTSSIGKQTQELKESYEQQQKQMGSELMRSSEQQMAALRQEIAQVKQEQQQAIKQATEAATASAKQIADQQAVSQAAQQALMATKAKRTSTLLTSKTPPGKRAVTVMIESLNAVGGLLNAGDFVDVIAHLDVPQENDKKKTITAMVFQDLQVLAINTNLDDPGAYDDQQGAASLKITFAVDPQEAGLLAFANKNGKLELALRAPNETDKQSVKSSTWQTLADYVLQNQGEGFNVPAEEAKPVKEAEKPYIQIFRGGKEL
jgi:pilus assembly protein CpaB